MRSMRREGTGWVAVILFLPLVCAALPQDSDRPLPAADGEAKYALVCIRNETAETIRYFRRWRTEWPPKLITSDPGDTWHHSLRLADPTRPEIPLLHVLFVPDPSGGVRAEETTLDSAVGGERNCDKGGKHFAFRRNQERGILELVPTEE